MLRHRRIVILTGAGISAESGLGTFRDVDGLWTTYDLDEVATPEGFARNPALVHAFYNARRRNLLEARPRIKSGGGPDPRRHPPPSCPPPDQVRGSSGHQRLAASRCEPGADEPVEGRGWPEQVRP